LLGDNPVGRTAISLGILATKLRQWDRQARASVFRGKSTRTDYVYVMDFEDGKIRYMTKIWLGLGDERTALGLTRLPAFLAAAA
jgi:hypothetical protein